MFNLPKPAQGVRWRRDDDSGFMFGISPNSRMRSLACVLAGHGVAIWLVLSFAHISFLRERETIVGIFDVRPVELPPPVEPPPAPARVAPKLQGAAAPARPAAPPADSAVPQPVAATIATPAAPSLPPAGGPMGAVNGTGGGGTGGAGSGLGSAGAGVGSLRPVVAARWRGGEIAPRDYPRSARGAQGIVTARVAVGVDGRVTGCSVARSSGNAILDSTTCRLIRERFRFTPARNAQGEAVPGEYGWQQRWWRD